MLNILLIKNVDFMIEFQSRKLFERKQKTNKIFLFIPKKLKTITIVGRDLIVPGNMNPVKVRVIIFIQFWLGNSVKYAASFNVLPYKLPLVTGYKTSAKCQKHLLSVLRSFNLRLVSKGSNLGLDFRTL